MYALLSHQKTKTDLGIQETEGSTQAPEVHFGFLPCFLEITLGTGSQK